MPKRITVDIMDGGTFLTTLRIPLFDVVVDYDGDCPVIGYELLVRYVEEKRPSLKYRRYQIYF